MLEAPKKGTSALKMSITTMSNILKNQSLKIQYTMPTGGEAILLRVKWRALSRTFQNYKNRFG